MKLRWILVYLSLNAVLATTTYASYKIVEGVTVKSLIEQLNTVLDSRLAVIGTAYQIPSDRNSFSLNSVMGKQEKSLGETGESYIIEKKKNALCRMASRSRFEDYNRDNGVFHCADHWLAVFKSSSRTEGIWIDYRGIEVYGVGQRFQRSGKLGVTSYGIIVERDASEVRLGVVKLNRLSIIVLIGFAIGSAIGCFIFYLIQQKSLRSAKENHLILKNVPSGIVRVDENRLIQSVNAAMARTFGYEDEKELLHKDVGILFPESNIQLDVDSFHRAMEGSAEPEDLKLQFEGLKKDGTIFPLELTRHVVEFPEGRQILKVFGDRTKEVADMERIERKNAAMRSWSYIARHDLQNTVSPAALAIEYMIEAGHDQDALEMAHKELQGAMKMFQDLSEWSKSIESDDGDIDREMHSLNALVSQTMIEGVNIHVGKLGDVYCNEGTMLAAIRNCLENSVKYCPGSPDIEIYREGDKLVFSDNSGGFGCTADGYDEKYAKRLSQPGQRGNSGVDGSGLGIANMIAVLQANGFSLSWESNCGVGTRWYFHLT